MKLFYCQIREFPYPSTYRLPPLHQTTPSWGTRGNLEDTSGPTSRSFQATVPKRKFPSERPRANVPKRMFPSKSSPTKLVNRSCRAKVLTRKIPNESFQKTVSNRKTAYESSQAKDPKRKLPGEGSQTKVPQNDSKRTFSSEGFRAKDLKAKMPTTILTKSSLGPLRF